MHCKTNRQLSVVCNLIDHRNDVIMFKTFSVLHPSRTARQGFHSSVEQFDVKNSMADKISSTEHGKLM